MNINKYLFIGILAITIILGILLGTVVDVKKVIHPKMKLVVAKIIKASKNFNIKKVAHVEKTTNGPVEIRIYPYKEKRKISRLLYGSNLSPKMESDYYIWDIINTLGISCFRYPGGGSPGWHWETGMADFNPRIKNMPLGNVDYLVKFCKKTNTSLIMQVNVESGTPEEAAKLVAYLNKKADFRVEYWELGNEVYGDWDKGYCTPEKYINTIKEYSLAMKAVDPTIKIGANWGGRYYDKIKWDETVIKGVADYIDFVSFHWYPNHTNASHKYEGRAFPTPEEIMANAMAIPSIVKRVDSIIEKEAPHRKGKIEVTFLEWDGAWDAPASDSPPYKSNVMQWSLVNAIFYADCLGLFAENGVTISTHYTFQECPFGLIRGFDVAEYGGQKWDTETIRPKAFVIQLFSKHFGDTLIKSEVGNSPYYYKREDWWPSSYKGDVPYVTCYASKFSESNKLGVVLVNKHSEKNIDVNISIDKIGNGECDIWVLAGPDIMSQNDGSAGRVRVERMKTINISGKLKYTVPAHSIVAMEIKEIT
jgi:alpha-L-arabinofuranosidase